MRLLPRVGQPIGRIVGRRGGEEEGEGDEEGGLPLGDPPMLVILGAAKPNPGTQQAARLERLGSRVFACGSPENDLL